MKTYPRLKFCGITREVDVEGAIEAGACAIGLNFVPSSLRYISLRLAADLSRAAAGRIQRIGVFVNATPQHVADVLHVCELDGIQLHGDEPLGWLREAEQFEGLRDLPVLRSLPYRGAMDDAIVSTWSNQVFDQASPVSAILIDAFDPTARGGTGKTARWDLLSPRPHSFYPSNTELAISTKWPPAPMILAGGIQPSNVSDACMIAQPSGIDVASGIETAPGIKDRDAMLAIADAVRSFFQ
jgi:phosphoribosylanthranilate isomerase